MVLSAISERSLPEDQTVSRDPLLQPLTIKNLVLRNRIMSTSHSSFLDDGGLPLERYQRYHEEKAKGGLALTMFGGSSMVDVDSSWGGGGQLNMATDEIIPHLQALSTRIHAHGAATMCQISHLGRRADAMTLNWLPAIAPSRSRETQHRAFSREMDEHDIRRVVKAYGEAARRCREGGLDGIETLTGGHLIGQFFSPRTNFRSDRFGGSVENRVRFGLMVHEEIRRQLGDDLIVSMRFVIDEAGDEGLTFEDCLEIAEIFEREGLIDVFNCIFGRMDTVIALAEQNMPGMASPIGPFLAKVGAFRTHTRLPVFHAARIPDIATARHAIRDGLLDMVAMTRAHMADPQLVNKLKRGEEDRIRPCVGASYCMIKKVNCIHNPASGRETLLPQVIPASTGKQKKVVVVGAGPAGLEAARVCAERGHKVVVFEAGDKPGGQLLLATRAIWRRDLIAIVDWRVAELQTLNVDLRCGIYAGRDEILAETPDIVVIATGGLPDTEWLEGAEFCETPWDILGATTPQTGDILVYDGTGRHDAPSTALHLAGQGATIRYVTPDDSLSQEVEYSTRAVYRKSFKQHNITFTTEHRLISVRKSNRLTGTFRHELTGDILEMEADRFVVEQGTFPLDDVFSELRALSANDGITDLDALLEGREQPEGADSHGFQLHRIGDAVASRNVHTAIYDAMRLCVAF